MTEEQITRLYGPRCTEHCDDCCVCEVWAMHDRIEELDRHLTLSGKVSKALSERIEKLEADKARLREALEWVKHCDGIGTFRKTDHREVVISFEDGEVGMAFFERMSDFIDEARAALQETSHDA